MINNNIPSWNEFKIELKNINYSETTIARCRFTYLAFINDYCQRKSCRNPLECINNGLKVAEADFRNGLMSKDRFLRLRRVGAKLTCIVQKEKLAWIRLPLIDKKYASKLHESLLKSFLDFDSEIHAASINYRSEGIVRSFLIFIEAEKSKEISAINEQDVLDFLKFMKGNRPAGLKSVVSSMKHFFNYLIKQGLIQEYLKVALQHWDTPHMKVYGLLSQSEKKRILDSVDCTTAIGKRDYAIFSLAIDCGLRSSDIAALKLTNIDWKNATLSIVQSKTSKPLILPFSVDTGNAMVDYILNVRGKTKLPYVFIKNSYCDTKITSSLLCVRLKKYIKLAGISRSPEEKISMHTFRRSLGTELMESGSTLEMTSQVLGHNGVSATQRYVSFSKDALLDCPLDLPILLNMGDTND